MSKTSARSPRRAYRRAARAGLPGLLLLVLALLLADLALASLARAQAPAAAAAPLVVPPPTNLRDLTAWLDYRNRNHLAALPQEARLFYRQGLMLAQSGNRSEAIRQVRGASELDPSFVAPHLTLAAWLLLREPSQALLQYVGVIELARQNFLLQLALAGNLLYLGLQSLFLGLLAAALILVGLRNRELRHGWNERLGRILSPRTARWWSWALLVLPFVCGFGLALPAIFLLALLWPLLRAGERAVLVALVLTLAAAPWAIGTLDRLAVPLREGGAPFHGVALSATDPYSRASQEASARLAEAHPQNAFAQFAAAWNARRGGDLTGAEAFYRRALASWPNDDRVMNNLGNTLAMEGRTDEALDLYRRAGEANPTNAAAAFNASQIFTQRFDYRAATDALSRASALNFDLVKTYQAQGMDDGVLPLADQWIAPRTFWRALSGPGLEAGGRGALPPAWRGHLECSGLPFSLLVAALLGLGLALGYWQHRGMPLRTCSNCGGVVCRRCACRQREVALCPACAGVQARAETPDFGRVLLLQERRRQHHRAHMLRTALATLVPGFGLMAFRRVVGPVLLLAASAALLSLGAGTAVPFSFEVRPTLPEQELPLAVLVGAWCVVYAASLLGYLRAVVRADAAEAAAAAPIKSRIRLTSQDRQTLAA